MDRDGAESLTVAWPLGPTRPAAPRGEVHVWRATPDEGDSQLPLRDVLCRYLDIEPGAIPLQTGGHGKPELDGGGPPRFNLSHSGGLALVAVSAEREVGVDVERIVPRRDFLALAARALGPEAVAALEATEGEERAGAFYDLWVRHEARLKCGGSGLAGPEPQGPVAVSGLTVGDGYAAALAVAGTGAPPVRCFSLVRR
jgi:4'-phosphopantetheinyl transferase